MPQILEKIRPEVRECIDRCTECHRVCEETITYCLEQGGKHADPDHIRLLRDCVQICMTSADFMLRNSDQCHLTCAACAEICDRCADDCERFGSDEKMRYCAEVCRRCAESCRRH